MALGNEQYVNKKVIIVKKSSDGSEAVEVEGTVQAANEAGVLIKPKGKTTVDIIEAGDIEEIRYVADKPKTLAAKTLKHVEFGGARNHLLERHGFTLAQINGMDEQAAFDAHNEIDHEASDLGHVHGDKSKTERVDAVENAGDEA